MKIGETLRVVDKELQENNKMIRRTGGVLEEAALLDGTEVNERVLPTLNVSRRDILGRITPGENTQSQTWIVIQKSFYFLKTV